MINGLKLTITMAALVFVFSIAALAQKGDFRAIATNDPGAGLAADAAVYQQSAKTKKTIKLNIITKAEDREPKLGARDFRFCLNVDAANKQGYAQAVVSMDQYTNYKLLSWTDGGCDGYTPIENGDGGAGLAADYAIQQQAAKTKAKITPATIVKAEDQEPSLGYRNFRLCLTTTVNGKPSSPQVVVSMDQYSNFKLISWTDGKCGEPAGEGYTVVANDDAGIGLAADFAVKKHSETTKIPHTLTAVLKGEEKGKFAMTYRVCMKIKEKNESLIVQAVVTSDKYSNLKLVSWEHSKCGN